MCNSVSAEAISAARASLPSNQESVRLYAEGRARLWAFDFLRAHVSLLKAVAADPNYPLAHSALSEAWWHQGYLSKARNEAQRALELSQQLPREEQLLVEGQYRRSIADWPQNRRGVSVTFRSIPLLSRLRSAAGIGTDGICRQRTPCEHWTPFIISHRLPGMMRAST